MPMHDWTTVKAGTYHNFHYSWIATMMNRLNAGLLPEGYFAMAEQIIGNPEADLHALQTSSRSKFDFDRNGGVAIAQAKPKTRFVMPLPIERYARMANRIAIHHDLGNVVAVIELVSPGNKDRRRSLATFVEKSVNLLFQQVNLLIVDPFPPTRHDPNGIHGAILEELTGQEFELPADKRLTTAAYQVEPELVSFVETIAVGDPLPDMPVFLNEDQYVNLPLEETYEVTWNVLPKEIRSLFTPSSKV